MRYQCISDGQPEQWLLKGTLRAGSSNAIVPGGFTIFFDQAPEDIHYLFSL